MSEYLLHELAGLGDWKQIEVLFRINAVKDVNLQDDDFEGQTSLHWAVRKGNIIKCSNVLYYKPQGLGCLGISGISLKIACGF